MPRISEDKKKKISEQILHFLFVKFPTPMFTVEVAKEIARDEEFVKALLLRLEKERLVVKISKNQDGYEYKKRLRWRLSNNMQETYETLQ